MNTVSISKNKIARDGGVVVLPIEKYEALVANSIPTYYLAGKEAEDLDILAKEGAKEYKTGKTIKANSLKEALRKYGKGGKH